MFSPKKESCINVPEEGAARPGSAANFFDRPATKPPVSEALRLRDKALPDRLVIATLLCDTIVIVYGLIFSFWVRFHTPVNELGIPVNLRLQDYAGYIAFGAVALTLILTKFGIYERNALLRYRFVSLQSLKACLWWAAAFLSISLVLRFEPPISRLFVVLSSVLTPAALLAWRWILHRYLARSFVAVNLRQRVLFVGWNKDAARLANEFAKDPVSAYQVVGCIGSKGVKFSRALPIPVLGHYHDLLGVLREQAIDMVVLTDVNGAKGDIVTLANTCEREMVAFKLVPSYFKILVSGLHLETVSGIPVLGVSHLPLDRFSNIALKRALDIAGSVFGLLLSVPFLLIFGFLIRRESPGPIFFSQERMGRRGQGFQMYKLRSMRLGSEKSDHLSQSTVQSDPRLLKIGALMRRWNIDELPQFWNVLRGEMSLVGPRPERTFHSEKLRDTIPHYNARYNATPGMTGWAQVQGLRGDTDLTARINCDLWYLENWSVVLDFQIMFLTLARNKNAV